MVVCYASVRSIIFITNEWTCTCAYTLPPQSCCHHGPVQTASPRSSTVAHQSVLSNCIGTLARVGQRGEVCFQTSRTRPSNRQLQTAIPSCVCPAPLEQFLAPPLKPASSGLQFALGVLLPLRRAPFVISCLRRGLVSHQESRCPASCKVSMANTH